MPKLAPIKRKDLIYYLRKLGFDGPMPGGKHHYMQKSSLKVRIPNPHQGDIGRNLLRSVLKEADIKAEVWKNYKRRGLSYLLSIQIHPFYNR